MKFFSKRKSRHNAFCAFCRSPRRVERKRNVSFGNIVASAVSAGLLTILFWRAADPRGFVIFVVLLAGAELFVQLRWRLSIVCRACGFDPVMYLKNSAAAALKVREHLAARREDPSRWLAKPLDLPTIGAERAEELEKLALQTAEKRRGSLVSRSI